MSQSQPLVSAALPLGDLLALGNQLRTDDAPDQLLHEVAEALRRIVASPQVYVSLRNMDTDALEALAFAGVDADQEQQLRAEVLPPSVYQELLRPERRVGEAFLLPATETGEASLLLVPLRGRAERLIGLVFISLPPDTAALEPAVLSVIAALTRQAALAVENVRLAERSARLLAKEQLLAALGRDVSSTLDLQQILEHTVHRLHTALGSGAVALLDDHGMIEIAAAAASQAHLLGRRWTHSEGMLGWVVTHGQTFFANDVAAMPELQSPDATMAAWIIAPLRSGGQVIGMILVSSTKAHAFTYGDIDLIEAIAAQVGGPITSARLYRRAQAAAVLEERNRLARELHDSVTQQLFSMILTAQAARAQLERNPQRVPGQLERLQETATAALAEMRALIFQLRPPALRDQGLVAALQQQAQLLAQREGIKIGLSVIGDERLASGIEQPIFRIVQEALNNVCKHAGACNAQITLELTNESITVRVYDDGAGFDPEANPTSIGQQLGLLGMRERAAELGGSIELNSAPGCGTEVVVRVPRS
ncbi:GAF domain-containing sensor histidine kinase [Candidatus Viridilinea mediisalina]|uniref:Histidine kinase domain-containing protein n=1 Tax=Candidatus Viridilinea mediisalina TaxID=2024553 RepID=A0A2A6RKT4_9CHLR|nr:GAF domain-containing sensor histidine kinase [Candidatus Viridilinea mediisalina]PDW03450.1 hypothetical protein CJ255_08590 [Candidatus Viridilinea mediisalina]